MRIVAGVGNAVGVLIFTGRLAGFGGIGLGRLRGISRLGRLSGVILFAAIAAGAAVFMLNSLSVTFTAALGASLVNVRFIFPVAFTAAAGTGIVLCYFRILHAAVGAGIVDKLLAVAAAVAELTGFMDDAGAVTFTAADQAMHMQELSAGKIAKTTAAGAGLVVIAGAVTHAAADTTGIVVVSGAVAGLVADIAGFVLVIQTVADTSADIAIAVDIVRTVALTAADRTGAVAESAAIALHTAAYAEPVIILTVTLTAAGFAGIVGITAGSAAQGAVIMLETGTVAQTAAGRAGQMLCIGTLALYATAGATVVDHIILTGCATDHTAAVDDFRTVAGFATGGASNMWIAAAITHRCAIRIGTGPMIIRSTVANRIAKRAALMQIRIHRIVCQLSSTVFTGKGHICSADGIIGDHGIGRSGCL